jgi:hypothetical protein
LAIYFKKSSALRERGLQSKEGECASLASNIPETGPGTAQIFQGPQHFQLRRLYLRTSDS